VFIGNEFKGYFNKILNKHSIKHILTSSPEIKSNYVERFHRTFRGKLSKRIAFTKNKNWTKVFQQLIDTYNDTPHRGLFGVVPNDVTLENSPQLFFKMYDNDFREAAFMKINYQNPKFKLGDLIRVAIVKKGFEKMSSQSFTDEIFSIHRIIDSFPVTYKIKDSKDNIIVGSYYEAELQRVVNAT